MRALITVLSPHFQLRCHVSFWLFWCLVVAFCGLLLAALIPFMAQHTAAGSPLSTFLALSGCLGHSAVSSWPRRGASVVSCRSVHRSVANVKPPGALVKPLKRSTLGTGYFVVSPCSLTVSDTVIERALKGLNPYSNRSRIKDERAFNTRY